MKINSLMQCKKRNKEFVHSDHLHLIFLLQISGISGIFAVLVNAGFLITIFFFFFLSLLFLNVLRFTVRKA